MQSGSNLKQIGWHHPQKGSPVCTITSFSLSYSVLLPSLRLSSFCFPVDFLCVNLQGLTLPPLPHPWFRMRRAVTPDTLTQKPQHSLSGSVTKLASQTAGPGREGRREQQRVILYYSLSLPPLSSPWWPPSLSSVSDTLACFLTNVVRMRKLQTDICVTSLKLS